MAKHTGKLTKTAVDGWEYQLGDPILWDGKLSGFGVKANAGGSKSYIIDYRNQYNVQRRYTIGKHGGKLTCELARDEADNLLARIRMEKFDPLADKQKTRQALSVNQVLDLYLASSKFAEKTPMCQYNDTGRIKRHLRPTLGKLKAEQVTPDRVRRAFADIRDGKTAVVEKTKKARGKSIVRGGEGAARMAIRNLRAIYTWAIKEGLASHNPAEKIEIGTDGSRDTILETPEQYAALFKALDTLQTTRQIPDAAADAIRVLAFTGARRNEIAAMRWRYVDLDRGVVTLPPKAHKTGHRSGKPKEIGLNSTARAIIASRPKGGPDDWVFPATKGEGHITLPMKLWGTIRAEAGLPDGIGNHALRHSLGTLMAIQGAQAAEIMATLGHTQLSTAQRYLHIAKDAKAAMSEKYTAGIAAAVNTAPKAEVVDIDTKRGAK
tara:strand:- start:253632 stop:254939 length:1308 start_codon:yes stop_codon:yes gene_type:complete